MKFILYCAFFIFATGSDHDCGRQKLNNDLIVGNNAEPVEFPWLVQLRYKDKQGKEKQLCAGSLINKRFVLTTAVCVHGSPYGMPIKATLGEYYTDPDEHDDYKRQEFGIERVIANIDYDKKTYVNDIALLKLDADVNFTDYIQPICLPFNKEAHVLDKVATSGWGKSNHHSGYVRSKKKVISTILDHGECKEKFKRFVTISDTHLCTKALDGNIELTCSGDSGGPVVSLVDGKWYQQGIVSFGVSQCGSDFPDVNTNVAKYLDWITENINQVNSTLDIDI